MAAAPLNHRILVADDDPDLLESLVEALTASGATVVSATTGAELLERIAESGSFDLVITDVSMPWMTGLQVATSMREAGLDVPVIVMTGLSDVGLAERVRAIGVNVILLRKPFDMAQLRTTVTLAVAPVGGAETPTAART